MGGVLMSTKAKTLAMVARFEISLPADWSVERIDNYLRPRLEHENRLKITELEVEREIEQTEVAK